MKIKEINVWKADLELTRPYTIAFKTVSAVENVLVELVAENGLTGIGAGNPSKEVTGEAFATTWQAVQPENLDWLVGRDLREVKQLCEELTERLPHNPAARAAVDIALHDLFCKYLEVPLVTYLGQKLTALPTSITIGIKNVAETLEEAEEYVGRGFTHLKVKTGQSVEEDVERLVKLREVYGNRIFIRIDANQGYSAAELEEFCARSAKLDLELIEQPLQANIIDELRGLPASIKDLVAADESLLSPADAFKLASPPRACGIFNIKLMKCGGVHAATKIGTVAQLAGIDLMWGCNDESIVSITAALHAAFSFSNTKYIDLDGSLDLAKDVVSGGFLIENGLMRPNGKAGLGVERLKELA
ncbi:mandelate racemase/muconate lactonizing enzyme family protein [Rufibacter quisquiliarum]|uniref:Dipeptide epimerase n=1 Tax=Rufibacter quisquiliarum TaxID=1549639 RepID=A0A839GUI2_9BACT|nr:dipeptide epimerase [Rufibacter quisquiliarum]MBA9078078.1 L-alanine-DL-glutamate epimerase-like enolase superfamily enzyme [Rufibacter quisquiliarum]